jgi:flavin reductase (DIM6/NTAB) family NADH-FMN oxidoreductase RutF
VPDRYRKASGLSTPHGAVVPRPIGWASTVSKSGITNLAPFSFFTVVCVIPPMISLARNPDGTEKHTLKKRARDILFQRGDRAGVEENGGFG